MTIKRFESLNKFVESLCKRRRILLNFTIELLSYYSKYSTIAIVSLVRGLCNHECYIHNLKKLRE
jgi:hypothetical protein